MKQEGRRTLQRPSELKQTALSSWYVLAYHSHSRVLEKSGSLLWDLLMDKLTQSRTLDWSIRFGLALECRWIVRTLQPKGKREPFLIVLRKISGKSLCPIFGASGADWCKTLTRLDHCHHPKGVAKTGHRPNQAITWSHMSVSLKVLCSGDSLEHTLSRFDHNGGFFTTTKPLFYKKQRTNHQHGGVSYPHALKSLLLTSIPCSFSAFGLLGNKGMHCYNGNGELRHTSQWYKMITAIHEDEDISRRYVDDYVEHIWEDLNLYHKERHPDCPLDTLCAKKHILDITDIVVRTCNITVCRSERQTLTYNMGFVADIIFEMRETHPYRFGPVKVPVAKPLIYKVRYIDVTIAVKTLLPTQKGKPWSYAGRKTDLEIERNLKFVSAKSASNYKWWVRSLAQPCPPHRYFSCGGHKTPSFKRGFIPPTLDVQKETGLDVISNFQPQEGDMANAPTLHPLTTPFGRWLEWEIALVSQLSCLNNRAINWRSRSNAGLTSTDLADLILEKLSRESTRLTTILPAWSYPRGQALTTTHIVALGQGVEYYATNSKLSYFEKLSLLPRSRGDGAPDTTQDLGMMVLEKKGSSSGGSGE